MMRNRNGSMITHCAPCRWMRSAHQKLPEELFSTTTSSIDALASRRVSYQLDRMPDCCYP